MARLPWWHLLGRTLLGSQAFLQKSIFQFEKKSPSELLEASAVTGVSTHILTPCLLRVACISLLHRHLGPSGPSGHGPWEEGFLRRFFISCFG